MIQASTPWYHAIKIIGTSTQTSSSRENTSTSFLMKQSKGNQVVHCCNFKSPSSSTLVPSSSTIKSTCAPIPRQVLQERSTCETRCLEHGKTTVKSWSAVSSTNYHFGACRSLSSSPRCTTWSTVSSWITFSFLKTCSSSSPALVTTRL